MSDLQIRPVAAADRSAWSGLWDRYLAFYETARDGAQHDLTWARILDPDVPMHALLAWDGENAIGLANFLYHPGFWDAGDLCYLNDLFVEPSARGSGAGAALIEAVARDAAQKEVSEFYWLTAESNQTARALYDRVAERSGFLHYCKPV